MHHIMPGKHGSTPEIMMHYLLGDEASAAVGLRINQNLWEKIVEWFLTHLFRHNDRRHRHINDIVKLGDNLKMKFLQGSVNYFNDHKNVTFYIPPGLREDWKV